MLLKSKRDGHLVEVLAIKDLTDPYREGVVGRLSWGEDVPEPGTFAKSDLVFPSGEALPRCWVDAHYRDEELKR